MTPILNVLWMKKFYREQGWTLQLLAERDRIQAALDEWHRSNPGPVKDKAAYKSFLRELGYLVPQPERVTVETTGIDSEITSQAGPQLVVPAMNARYALNAANARLIAAAFLPHALVIVGPVARPVPGLFPFFGKLSFQLPQLDFLPLVQRHGLRAQRRFHRLPRSLLLAGKIVFAHAQNVHLRSVRLGVATDPV